MPVARLFGVALATLVTAVLAAAGAPSQAAAAPCATSEVVDGSRLIATISAVGTCDWTVPAGITAVDLLIVGGGGGGGGATAGAMAGGGGGGGAVRAIAAQAVTPGATLSITVGAGGTGGNGARGSAGGASSITIGGQTTTALGGGAGASSVAGASNAATTGGPGGGGSVTNNISGAAGSSTGTAGGNGPDRNRTNAGAGGGGGAGGNGAAGLSPDGGGSGAGGAGGTGIAWQGVTYGGGGGGGAGAFGTLSTAGAGGFGGGGTGAFSSVDQTFAVAPTAGVDGRGGGGGGARPCCGGGDATAVTRNGASGGSGVVRLVLGTVPAVLTPAAVSPATGALVAVGTTLAGTQATFDGNPAVSVDSAWYACGEPGAAANAVPADCAVILGQTSSTLSAAQAMVGRYIRFASEGSNGLGSPALSVSGTSPMVASVPSAPTGVTAVAGNASAVVSWTAPASSGAAPITGFFVTADPGGASCEASGMSNSCTVVGLANRTAYRFSVVAINVIGTSAPSEPSASVTPSMPGSGDGVPTPAPTPAKVSLSAGTSSTVQRRSITVTTQARVNQAGVILLRGRVVPRATESVWRTSAQREMAVVACSDGARVSRAGTYRLVCTLGAGARALVQRRALRVRLSVTFRPSDGGAQVTTTRVVTIPRYVPPVPRTPVTG